MGLGRAGQGGVSLEDARDKAKELNDTLDKGVNPLMARRERQQAEAARKTLRQATEAFIEEKNPKWGASSRAIWRRLADRDIEVIADIPVDTLGRGDIARAVHALYGQVGKGNRARLPGVPAARQLQQRIQKVLEYASESGWRPENARCQWSMVAEHANGEARTPPSGLDAARTARRAGRRADRRGHPAPRASDSVSARCLEFIALTAVRVSEAARGQVGEFNLKTKVWAIPSPE